MHFHLHHYAFDCCAIITIIPYNLNNLSKVSRHAHCSSCCFG